MLTLFIEILITQNYTYIVYFTCSTCCFVSLLLLEFYVSSRCTTIIGTVLYYTVYLLHTQSFRTYCTLYDHFSYCFFINYLPNAFFILVKEYSCYLHYFYTIRYGKIFFFNKFRNGASVYTYLSSDYRRLFLLNIIN